MEDENPTENSPDIGIAASDADPSHDLTEQIDTPMYHRSREQKKSPIEKIVIRFAFFIPTETFESFV